MDKEEKKRVVCTSLCPCNQKWKEEETKDMEREGRWKIREGLSEGKSRKWIGRLKESGKGREDLTERGRSFEEKVKEGSLEGKGRSDIREVKRRTVSIFPSSLQSTLYCWV